MSKSTRKSHLVLFKSKRLLRWQKNLFFPSALFWTSLSHPPLIRGPPFNPFFQVCRLRSDSQRAPNRCLLAHPPLGSPPGLFSLTIPGLRLHWDPFPVVGPKPLSGFHSKVVDISPLFFGTVPSRLYKDFHKGIPP